MYFLTDYEVEFAVGLVLGVTASIALVLVPVLWRVLALAALGWLTWRLSLLGPQQLGLELLKGARWLGAEWAFVQGFLLAKGGVGLTAFLLRRRAR